jgi:hypothetical protein
MMIMIMYYATGILKPEESCKSRMCQDSVKSWPLITKGRTQTEGCLRTGC